MKRPAGPFVPITEASMRFSMAGDDCSLHFDLDALSQKQQADHRANQVLTGMLQLALMYMAKPQDQVCLYEAFDQAPWREARHRYLNMFTRMGLCSRGFARTTFHGVDDYYESVAKTETDAEYENLYMISGSNAVLHQSQAALQMSRNLNSKDHFAEYAPAFGLPVPETIITTKTAIADNASEVNRFLQTHGPDVMLKTLGLAGARNVTSVSSRAEALQYLDEYPADEPLILQAKLNTKDYIEMTVDLQVSEARISISNVRKILFAEGLWVGNLMGSAGKLSAQDEATLLRVGEYARDHGFLNPDVPAETYNLGIDYFVRSKHAAQDLPALIVTEINARWTGGLFPAELVRRLDCGHLPVVAFIDMCPADLFYTYLDFVEQHLYDPSSAQPWSIAPMGFSPLTDDVDGVPHIFVWQIVIGDFKQFKADKAGELGEQALVTVPLIDTDQ